MQMNPSPPNENFVAAPLPFVAARGAVPGRRRIRLLIAYLFSRPLPIQCIHGGSQLLGPPFSYF